jgi:magnesium chelatase family protein
MARGCPRRGGAVRVERIGSGETSARSPHQARAADPQHGDMLAVARTFALVAIEAEAVHVEVDVTPGLPGFAIVGLPDTSVRESRERVRSALLNSGFEFPMKRITANLAPAALSKAGPGFDLALAAALLAATGQVERGVMERFALAGELALDGSIRPVPGALAMAEGARRQGLRGIAVAPADAPQAALVEGLEVVALDHVARLPALATGELDPVPEADRSGLTAAADPDAPDLADLKGQPTLRRALEIAAAGGHSLLLTGPPGAGKTLAARRLPSLMPPLTHEEAMEVIRVTGACGPGPVPTPVARPFRAPHHTASARALIGGGTPPKPGEVTRAHRGILFLDELAEFRRDSLEALRQPLEESSVTLSRVTGTVSVPCRFTLVAASNPCPCGHGTDSGECECHHGAAARYQAKLSGALADRIDIQVPVDRPSADDLADGPGEGSAAVRERVAEARRLQSARLGPGRCNAEMGPAELRRHCVLDRAAESVLKDGHGRLTLSGRGWDRVLRVARTIADLEGDPALSADHVLAALGFRRRAQR